MRRLCFLTISLSVLVLGACDGEDEPPGVCAEEDRAVPIDVDVDMDGESGAVVFRMLSMDPDPPDLGDNDWTVLLTDADGEPLEGCNLRAEPWMPDHGHGSNEPEGVAGSAAGEYVIEGLELIMPGYWTVAMMAECGELTDSVVLKPCVEG